MQFTGVITNGKSDVSSKGQGQKSEVEVTKVKTQFSRFGTKTPFFIHRWLWNDAKAWSSIEEVP